MRFYLLYINNLLFIEYFEASNTCFPRCLWYNLNMAKRINPHTGKWEDVETSEAMETPITEAKTFIPDLSDDDLRKLAREKLSEALQAIDPATQPELTRKLCAEVKDRLDGKPAQQVTVDQTLRTVNVIANISFIPARREEVLCSPVNNAQVIDNNEQ